MDHILSLYLSLALYAYVCVCVKYFNGSFTYPTIELGNADSLQGDQSEETSRTLLPTGFEARPTGIFVWSSTWTAKGMEMSAIVGETGCWSQSRSCSKGASTASTKPGRSWSGTSSEGMTLRRVQKLMLSGFGSAPMKPNQSSVTRLSSGFRETSCSQRSIMGLTWQMGWPPRGRRWLVYG